MLEYQTLRVDPDREVVTIRNLAKYGWKLEETREVYNESDQVVGINAQSRSSYYGDDFIGSFMQGLTNSSGKTTSQINVQTQTCVTHFLSMRFSRDTSMKNYARLRELEQLNPWNGLPELKQEFKLTDKPALSTGALIVLSLFTLLVSLTAIFAAQLLGWIAPAIIIPLLSIIIISIRWAKYKKIHPKEVAELQAIKQYNETTQKQNSETVKAINERKNEEIKQIMIENGFGEYWE